MYLNVQHNWDAIKEKTARGIQSLFPLEGAKNRLVLQGVDIKEPAGTLEEQRAALLKGKSLNASVYGSFDLMTGTKLINRDRVKILDLPIMTGRGTFVVLGKDYSVFNQMRLRPGVYTSYIADSDTVSSRFNLGKGLGFKINLEPSTSIFYIAFDSSKVRSGGQKIPLYSLLHALGASDDYIEKAWGPELFKVNTARKNIEQDMHQIVDACVYVKKRTGNDAQDIKDYYSTTQISPETTKVTLGEAFNKVTPGALIKASQKMIRVYNGKEEDDDLDSLLFKEVLATEDHIMLRIEKGAKQSSGPLFKIRRKLDRAATVKECVPISFLSKLVESFYTTSSLASPQTEINPIEILETHSKITSMGEGGIKSEHGIPMSARNLHPSHLNYVDPVRTTESNRVGVDVRMTHGASIKNRQIYSKFIDRNGKHVELTPIDLVGKVIGFPEQTTERTVRVMKDGEMLNLDRAQVDYWLEKPRDMFTVTSQLVPFLHNDQGNRVTMASRMITQAVSLKNREAPLVQVGNDNPGSEFRSLEHQIGSQNLCTSSPIDGVVREVAEKHIQIDKTKVELYKDFPLNYKSFITTTPTVKVGDKVRKGQVIAESNFTKGGTLALGLNLRTGYVPYDGYTHEDSVVVSESTAKRLTSEHMYMEELDLTPTMVIDKGRYASMFPSKILPEQLNKLDDRGIALKGIQINKGDYVVTALDKKEASDSDKILQRMHSSLANPFRDCSLIWQHDRPGIVTDIVTTSSMIKVVLKTEDEARLGDKLCYSPDTEVLTKRGWVVFPELTMDDTICCLNPEKDTIEYHKPTLVDSWEHTGEMYSLDTQALNFMVTPDHHMYVKERSSDKFKMIKARDIIGKRVEHKCDGIWNAPTIKNYVIPGVENKHKAKAVSIEVAMNDWLEFLGYYLSEGNSHYCNGNYSVVVHQSKVVHPEIYESIVNVIERLGFKGHQQATRITIHDKRLYTLLHSYGLCYEKRIPRYALEVSRDQCNILFKALMDGDGHWGETSWIYTTTSKGLADDLQELVLKVGFGSRVKYDPSLKSNELDKYRVHIRRAKLTPQVNHGHINTQNGQEENYVSYTGKVYCCTVPTHILYVRRKGKSAWCGNTGRHGNKGTIGLILPDNEMPYTKDNRPIDIMLNPASVISRVNPGQLYESMGGKIAEKTGKPYIVKNFDPEDSSIKVLREVKAHGLSAEETLIDPKTKKSLGKVFVGNPYMYKLHKQTEGNFAARSSGKYDANLQPAKGGEEGAKALGLQDFYALLAHNSRNILHESAAYKSQKNDEFWDAIKLGLPIPPAKEPFVFDKLKALLGATGINVRTKDTADNRTYQVTPITDKDVMDKSYGEVKNGLMLKGDVTSLIPEDGGLFDKETLGGLTGTNWGHINLAEPIAHPLFTKQIKTLLKGEEPLSMSGKDLHQKLSQINVPKRIEELRTQLKTARATQRDKIIKELRYLDALRKMGLHPKDYVLTKFPVIPPIFRPVFPSPSGGSPMISDLNHLYRDLMVTNSALHELKDLPEEHKVDLRNTLHQAAGAVVGITDPVNTKSQKQELKGALQLITGTTAKDGFFHRKLMYRTQDLTGRGTIIPDPKLHIDQCKIPIEMSYQLYKPFIIKKLVQMGYSSVQAAQEVQEKSDVAEQVMREEMSQRPVLLNRAPTLHKYNIMAFKPIPVEGKSVFIPPLVIKGFGADFDGDSVSGDTWVLVEYEDGTEDLVQIRDVQ